MLIAKLTTIEEQFHDLETLSGKLFVTDQSGADIANTHQCHAPAPVNAENLGHLVFQLSDRVA